MILLFAIFNVYATLCKTCNICFNSKNRKGDENSLELSKTISFISFDTTISFSIVKDTDNKPFLKFVYNWTNKGKDTAAPLCLLF